MRTKLIIIGGLLLAAVLVAAIYYYNSYINSFEYLVTITGFKQSPLTEEQRQDCESRWLEGYDLNKEKGVTLNSLNLQLKNNADGLAVINLLKQIPEIRVISSSSNNLGISLDVGEGKLEKVKWACILEKQDFTEQFFFGILTDNN